MMNVMRKPNKAAEFALNISCYILLVAGAFVCVYPLIFTVFAGFFSSSEFLARLSSMSLFPVAANPTFDNFLAIFKSKSDDLGAGAQMSKAFLNSLIRTSYSGICTVITSFIAGYAFNRLRFKGKNMLFMALLATVMLPGTITLIPTFIMYNKMKIYDTFFVYLVGGPSINILSTFVVMQSFDKIPVELDEAAKIDGASMFTTIFRVLFPIQISILTFVFVTTAIGVWNDWSTPFFFTDKPSLITLPGAITKMSAAMNAYVFPNYPLIISLGLAITIPSIIIYFIFQRFLIEGLANTGLKS